MSYVFNSTTNIGYCQGIFSAVKERLSMPQAAEFYGFCPNRAGFIRCPFHGGGAERTPSCKVYPERFHCFACQTGGDVVDFTARLFSLEPFAAVRKLNADFHLGLSLDKSPTQEERRKAAEARKRRERVTAAAERFEALRDATIRRLCERDRIANHALQSGPPWTADEVMAVRDQARTEYYLDVFENGSVADVLAVLRNGEVQA